MAMREPYAQPIRLALVSVMTAGGGAGVVAGPDRQDELAAAILPRAGPLQAARREFFPAKRVACRDGASPLTHDPTPG
jgi:hypothetical protein